MCVASTSALPVTCVFFTRSDPARSTSPAWRPPCGRPRPRRAALVHGEHAVRPRGRLVQDVVGDGAVALACEEKTQRLGFVAALLFREVLHLHLAVAVHHADEVRVRHDLVRQQVVHPLVVNLQVRHARARAPQRRPSRGAAGPRDARRADRRRVACRSRPWRRGVGWCGLARARLAVRENGAVVPGEHALAHLRGALCEHGLLRRGVQDGVELELDRKSHSRPLMSPCRVSGSPKPCDCPRRRCAGHVCHGGRLSGEPGRSQAPSRATTRGSEARRRWEPALVRGRRASRIEAPVDLKRGKEPSARERDGGGARTHRKDSAAPLVGQAADTL